MASILQKCLVMRPQYAVQFTEGGISWRVGVGVKQDTPNAIHRTWMVHLSITREIY